MSAPEPTDLSMIPGARRRREGPPRRGGGAVAAVLVVVALLSAGAAAVDVLAGPVVTPAAAPVAQPPAVSGIWYCPLMVTSSKDETGYVTVSAVGEEAARVVVERYAGGRPRADDARMVQPGESVVVRLEGEDARAPVAVRWSGGPAVASYRVEGDMLAAAPCEASPSEAWYVPGFDTTLGSKSRLYLFNPFPGDAVVRLSFATPDKPVRLVLTDNIVVPANGTKVLVMEEYQPEIPDLGAIVEVLSGRVVAQGQLFSAPPGDQPGPRGRTVLAAASQPSLTWGFAYARSDDSGSESWLSVVNPGTRTAAIEVRVSAPLGESSSLLGEVNVAAGTTARIELADASSNEEFGVNIESVNDVPVVATRLSVLSSGGRSGVAAALGAPAPATLWSLPGGGTEGRDAQVLVYNAGAEPATVDILAPGAPPAWSGLRVAPNGRVKVRLSELGTGLAAASVRVRSDRPVLAELQSASAGPSLGAWTAAGIAERVWVGPSHRPAVELDPGLSTRVIPTPTGEPTVAPVPDSEPPGGTQPATPEPAPGGEGTSA